MKAASNGRTLPGPTGIACWSVAAKSTGNAGKRRRAPRNARGLPTQPAAARLRQPTAENYSRPSGACRVARFTLPRRSQLPDYAGLLSHDDVRRRTVEKKIDLAKLLRHRLDCQPRGAMEQARREARWRPVCIADCCQRLRPLQ